MEFFPRSSKTHLKNAFFFEILPKSIENLLQKPIKLSKTSIKNHIFQLKLELNAVKSTRDDLESRITENSSSFENYRSEAEKTLAAAKAQLVLKFFFSASKGNGGRDSMLAHHFFFFSVIFPRISPNFMF